MTASIASAPAGVLEECSAVVVRAAGIGAGPGWLELCAGWMSGGSPGDVVDREPGRDRNGPGRYPGEGHDVPMQVGLVGIAAFCGYQGGAVTGGEAVRGVVEADQLRGALGGEAELGPEPGPQSLAAPPGLGRQPLDPDLSPAGPHLLPGEGDLRVGRRPRLASPGQRGLGDGEPVVPGPGRTRLRLIPQTRLALDNQRIVRPRRPLTSTSKSKPQAAMR